MTRTARTAREAASPQPAAKESVKRAAAKPAEPAAPDDGESLLEEEDDRARLFVLWRDSEDHRRTTRDIRIAALVVGIPLIGAAVWVLFRPDVSLNERVWMGVALFSVAYVATAVLLFYYQSRRRLFRLRHALGLDEKIREREREIADRGGELDFASIWSLTQDRIAFYHKIATEQSAVSFRNGAIASGAGFVFLLALGTAAVFVPSSVASAVTLGTLGAVGAALSGFLSATYMRAQSQASAQLREFFRQPVEFAQILGAERLIDTLPQSERADAVKLVVQSMTRGGGYPPVNETAKQ